MNSIQKRFDKLDKNGVLNIKDEVKRMNRIKKVYGFNHDAKEFEQLARKALRKVKKAIAELQSVVEKTEKDLAPKKNNIREATCGVQTVWYRGNNLMESQLY